MSGTAKLFERMQELRDERDDATARAERAEAALRDIAALDKLTPTPAPMLLVAIQRAQEALDAPA